MTCVTCRWQFAAKLSSAFSRIRQIREERQRQIGKAGWRWRVSVNGIFWDTTYSEKRSTAADDNYDSLRECNYSRRECGSLQLIASNCRMMRTDVFPVQLTAMIKREIKRAYRIQSSPYVLTDISKAFRVIRGGHYGRRNPSEMPKFASRN